MDLSTQVITLFFSFLYGIFFELTLHGTGSLIYHKSKLICYVSTFLFIISHVILYFIILQKINYGIVHIYSIISFILGFMFMYITKKYLFSRFTLFHKK